MTVAPRSEERAADIVCPCQQQPRFQDDHANGDYEVHLRDVLRGFSEVRNQCSALQAVLIPDDQWEEYQHWCLETDVALMRPTLYLAYKDRMLHRMTAPVHRLVLDGSEIKANVPKQYRKDLQETWLKKPTHTKRHPRAKSFLGRIYELLAVEWLTRHGWVIDNLELWGGDFDCEAARCDGSTCTFEVKYLGTEKASFEAVIDSLQGGSGFYSSSPYDAANYLLFQVGKAAQQLATAAGEREVLTVIEDISYLFPLESNFIDWQNPSFHYGSQDWQKFAHGRDLASKLRAVHQVDRIRILRTDHLELRELGVYRGRGERGLG